MKGLIASVSLCSIYRGALFPFRSRFIRVFEIYWYQCYCYSTRGPFLLTRGYNKGQTIRYEWLVNTVCMSGHWLDLKWRLEVVTNELQYFLETKSIEHCCSDEVLYYCIAAHWDRCTILYCSVVYYTVVYLSDKEVLCNVGGVLTLP